MNLTAMEIIEVFEDFLKDRGITSVFHYIPLHSAPAGERFGRFSGADEYTTAESNKLTRLPMYYGLTRAETESVVEAVTAFYGKFHDKGKSC